MESPDRSLNIQRKIPAVLAGDRSAHVAHTNGCRISQHQPVVRADENHPFRHILYDDLQLPARFGCSLFPPSDFPHDAVAQVSRHDECARQGDAEARVICAQACAYIPRRGDVRRQNQQVLVRDQTVLLEEEETDHDHARRERHRISLSLSEQNTRQHNVEHQVEEEWVLDPAGEVSEHRKRNDVPRDLRVCMILGSSLVFPEQPSRGEFESQIRQSHGPRDKVKRCR